MAGWALARLSGDFGLRWFMPANGAEGGADASFAPSFAWPVLSLDFLAMYSEPDFWAYLSVIVPMWLVALVNYCLTD